MKQKYEGSYFSDIFTQVNVSQTGVIINCCSAAETLWSPPFVLQINKTCFLQRAGEKSHHHDLLVFH